MVLRLRKISLLFPLMALSASLPELGATSLQMKATDKGYLRHTD